MTQLHRLAVLSSSILFSPCMMQRLLNSGMVLWALWLRHHTCCTTFCCPWQIEETNDVPPTESCIHLVASTAGGSKQLCSSFNASARPLKRPAEDARGPAPAAAAVPIGFALLWRAAPGGMLPALLCHAAPGGRPPVDEVRAASLAAACANVAL